MITEYALHRVECIPYCNEEVKMRISELAETVGLTIDTIRFYEKRGLLDSRLGRGAVPDLVVGKQNPTDHAGQGSRKDFEDEF